MVRGFRRTWVFLAAKARATETREVREACIVLRRGSGRAGRLMERRRGVQGGGGLGLLPQRDVSSSAVHDMQAAGGQPAAAHAGATFSWPCAHQAITGRSEGLGSLPCITKSC